MLWVILRRRRGSGSLFQLDYWKMSATFVVGHDQCQPNVGHATVAASRPFRSWLDALLLA